VSKDRLSTSNSGIVEERQPILFFGVSQRRALRFLFCSSELLAIGLREGALNGKMLSR